MVPIYSICSLEIKFNIKMSLADKTLNRQGALPTWSVMSCHSVLITHALQKSLLKAPRVLQLFLLLSLMIIPYAWNTFITTTALCLFLYSSYKLFYKLLKGNLFNVCLCKLWGEGSQHVNLTPASPMPSTVPGICQVPVIGSSILPGSGHDSPIIMLFLRLD